MQALIVGMLIKLTLKQEGNILVCIFNILFEQMG